MDQHRYRERRGGVCFKLMGEGKFLAGDGRKEGRSRLWRARECRSARSGFPLRGGEEERNSKRRSEGRIYEQLVRVAVNSTSLNSGASFGRILEWKEQNLEEPGHYYSFIVPTWVPTSTADRADSRPVHKHQFIPLKTFYGHALMGPATIGFVLLKVEILLM